MQTVGRLEMIDEPRDFGLHELFFSTTDKRGVIRYGNDVFSRIAGYSLAEMVGRPHNIIRHPDMPRCAFRLVWDYLKQDRPVAAYVKNLARDGRYYWVLALIVPTDDGYLSIRLKPSSPIFDAVRGAYAQVLQAEQRAAMDGLSSGKVMDAGAAKLMELLDGLGFDGYDELMWSAMTAEVTSRDAALSASGAVVDDLDRAVAGDASSARLLELYDLSMGLESQLADIFALPAAFSSLREQIVPKSKFILDMGHDIRLQSINAEIQAAHLGDAARALSVVAGHLGENARDGSRTARQLTRCLQQLIAPIGELVFNAMLSKIQVEMASSFVREIVEVEQGGTQDSDQVGQNLDLLFHAFLATVRGLPQVLERVNGQLAAIDLEVKHLTRFMKTLRFVYLSGRIETERQQDARAFATIFDQIQAMIVDSDRVLGDLFDQIDGHRVQLGSVHTVGPKVLERFERLLVA